MRNRLYLAGALAVLGLLGCAEKESPVTEATTNPEQDTTMVTSDNPFFVPSELQFGYPRFDLIKNEHYEPAMVQGMVHMVHL